MKWDGSRNSIAPQRPSRCRAVAKQPRRAQQSGPGGLATICHNMGRPLPKEHCCPCLPPAAQPSPPEGAGTGPPTTPDTPGSLSRGTVVVSFRLRSGGVEGGCPRQLTTGLHHISGCRWQPPGAPLGSRGALSPQPPASSTIKFVSQGHTTGAPTVCLAGSGLVALPRMPSRGTSGEGSVPRESGRSVGAEGEF